MEDCYPATPEYATAPVAVWWDMNDCRISEGYDVSRVRPNLEGALKRLGYTGPVSITAYGDLNRTPDDVLRGLVSIGVTVAHSAPGHICSFMFSDILKWRTHNRPPATMMLISNRVEDVLSWDLSRLQQETYYNFVWAYSVRPVASSDILISAEWLWDSLLNSPDNETPSGTETETVLFSAMFYCKLCSWNCQTLKILRKHLSSKKHIVKEARYPGDLELDPVTRMWGSNYKAKTEHETAKIRVWWNMDHCPIPEGYDARQVRPSLEGAFRSLGYTGPVSIIAFGDRKLTPNHVLEGLSSTGVDVAHSIPEKTAGIMYDDMLGWQFANPPPATMMLISDCVEQEQLFSHSLALQQQMTKYNFFLAYSSRPYKMSVLVTSAEWLWDTLLATVSETRPQLVDDNCSVESVESTGMFSCRLCRCDCKGLDHFREHLTSKVHSRRERYILSDIRYCEHQQELLREKETIIPDPVRKVSSQTDATKSSSQTDATQEKKNVVVASSLKSAAPPFYPSGNGLKDFDFLIRGV